ncbi:MAG: prolyl oligopeptidase family serine peptidase, partial [Candidatus Dormibacteraeota bacterium]|nr:prolyl oligopeptidase family serine peptidase [Candidatus Dormibacteraeota bacterium]
RQLLVHGDEDVRVPVEHSRDYVAAARAAGDPVEYVEIAGGDHFCVIDPAHAAWAPVRDWLSQAVDP